MTSDKKTIEERERSAKESRADAGLTQGTDRAIAYETGFQAGWEARNEEVKRLREALDLALYYVEGDATWESLVGKIETHLGFKLNDIRWTQEELDAAKTESAKKQVTNETNRQ